MYKIDLNTGNVYKDNGLELILVSPVENINDINFIEYNNWANLGNNPIPFIDNDLIKKLNQQNTWELIKSERDRLKFSGVKVGENWFHSDPDSRNQQLGLFTAAIAGKLPQNVIMWKTLTVGGGLYDNVEVPMNTELAIDIFVTTMMHDATFHGASGYHREQLLLTEDPLTYNYKVNWPESFESYRNQQLSLLQ